MLSVAVDEFAASGYAGASMNDIAQRAGISKPLVYQYFGSKDRLYLACLRAVGGRLLARLETAELAVDETVASRIHPLRAVFEALEPHRDAWLLLFDTSVPQTGEIAAVAVGYQARIAGIAATGSARFLAARGIDSESDAAALTDLWMGVVNSLVLWWLAHRDESAQDMIERCGRLLNALTT